MRSPTVAAQYFANLRKQFTLNTFANASLRARGLLPTNNVYEEFYIFQKTLSENEEYNTLTPLIQNQIIDYLVEQSI